MKRFICIFTIFAMLLSLNGCSVLRNLYEKEEPINRVDATEPVDQTEPVTEPTEPTEEQKYGIPFPLEMTFSSGAGAWWTELTLHADGTFTGYFQDSDMGDSDDSYPYGTVYYSRFSGKFTDLVKLDDNSFSMELESLEQKGTVGEMYVEEGIRYMVADPYGMLRETGIAKNFRLYLPTTPSNQLSEDALFFWPERYSDSPPDTLNSYCLLNADSQCAFFVYEN